MSFSLSTLTDLLEAVHRLACANVLTQEEYATLRKSAVEQLKAELAAGGTQ